MKNGCICMEGPPSEVFAQEEKLLEAGILAPQITRLSQKLREKIPLKEDALTPDGLASMLVGLKSVD
jgi:hypothetical protein